MIDTLTLPALARAIPFRVAEMLAGLSRTWKVNMPVFGLFAVSSAGQEKEDPAREEQDGSGA
jgi:hypothetical protein